MRIQWRKIYPLSYLSKQKKLVEMVLLLCSGTYTLLDYVNLWVGTFRYIGIGTYLTLSVAQSELCVMDLGILMNNFIINVVDIIFCH